ncbi:MAG: hypothetical protein E5Y61_00910 [Mesorhizobium sp.]|nr:MAG: hypothetical protein EOR98_26985 [Mesorhizobium sp.]RWN72813.1 MAG: hypothetical protein EOS02_25815 [Mesorhizobium sp.]RWN73120.1 MAG: hypothetical protein EOS01_26565 [Mesorhizobium sp.]RWN85224.1 MAG: hypothetical protein EOS04_24645 [Mesorhizobium sp.]RWO08173.1 MAG: hypothetical protein EOS15_29560 [Mesorhizobium sp.]
MRGGGGESAAPAIAGKAIAAASAKGKRCLVIKISSVCDPVALVDYRIGIKIGIDFREARCVDSKR